MKFIPLSEAQKDALVENKETLKDLQLKLQSELVLLQKGFDRLLCLDEINIEPKPWQEETALKVLRDMMGNALLADEVGLGKTIECGLIIKELLHRGIIHNVLVLVPAPLVDQWIEEMKEKFNIDFHNTKKKGWDEQELILSSIPMAIRSTKVREELENKFFDLIIVDEAHCLRNANTSTYKFIFKLQRKNTILMSATPIQNELEELYNLVNILRPGYLKSRKAFREEFLKNKFTPKNTQKLKELLNEVMIRHRRSNTLVELPKRIPKNIEVELNNDEQKFYHGVIAFCKEVYEQYSNKLVKVGKKEVNLLVLLLMSLLKQNCSSPQSVVSTLKEKMIPRLEDPNDVQVCEELIQLGESIALPSKTKQLLSEITSTKEQYIVYSEYQHTISLIQKHLEANGISVTTYHGRLSAKEKKESLKRFKKKEVQVFLSSESGGQGLNLQFCHKMINYDLPWNPMRIEQRIGRIHRFGQTTDVEICSIVSKGTIEEYILYVLTAKLNLFEMVIGELDTIMSYAMNDNEAVDVQIGKILLNSATPSEIEEKLRSIGENLLQARDTYDKEIDESTKILNTLGVGE